MKIYLEVAFFIVYYFFMGIKKPPLGGFLLVPWKWWSWGESNPRP